MVLRPPPTLPSRLCLELQSRPYLSFQSFPNRLLTSLQVKFQQRKCQIQITLLRLLRETKPLLMLIHNLLSHQKLILQLERHQSLGRAYSEDQFKMWLRQMAIAQTHRAQHLPAVSLRQIKSPLQMLYSHSVQAQRAAKLRFWNLEGSSIPATCAT